MRLLAIFELHGVSQLDKSRPAQSKLFRSTRQDDGASVHPEILDDECGVLGNDYDLADRNGLDRHQPKGLMHSSFEGYPDAPILNAI